MKIAFIIGLIILVFGIFMYMSIRRLKKMPTVADSQNIKQLNDSNFKKQISVGITVVDFWAEWCIPCKMMAPVLNAVAEETQGKVTVCKLNVDHGKQSAAKYNIKSIPTLIIFKNGKEVKRISGVKTKDYIIDQINRI